MTSTLRRDRKRTLLLSLPAIGLATMGALWLHWSSSRWTNHEHGELPVRDGRADVTFSEDGRRMAYVSRAGSTQHVVLDGRAQRAFDEVGALTFLRGGRLVYRARHGEKWLVVDNGRMGEEFDELGEIAVNASRSAYAVARRSKDAWTIGGDDGVLLERIDSAPMAIALGDDRSCVVSVKDGDRSAVVTSDGQRFGPFDYVGELSVTKDRRMPRFVALTGGAFQIFEGTAAVAKSDYLSRPLLDKAGRLVGHIEQKLHTSRVVFGPVRHPEFVDIVTTTISDDGQHVAYVARSEHGHTLVVDGVAANIDADDMSAPVFDAQGRASAAASVGPSVVIVNGSRMHVLENATARSDLARSPDGRVLGLGVSSGQRISWRTLDTQSPGNWLDGPAAAGRVWTYLRPDQERQGWHWSSRSGQVAFQGRKIDGIAVRPDSVSILASSRPAGHGAAILFVRSPGRTTRSFLVHLAAGKASALEALGASQILSWAPDGRYVVVEGRRPRSLVSIDTETAELFDLTGLLGGGANGVGASPRDVQWSPDGTVRVRAHTGCSAEAMRVECPGIDEPKRAFALTARPATRTAEGQRLDRPSPAGAGEALDDYWRKVSEGDLQAALATLSSSAREQMDGKELQVLRALSPLYTELAGRMSFTVKTLVVDGHTARATVALTLPDLARTAAGRALGGEMFSMMFSAAFLPEPEFVEQFTRMMERHAPALKAADPPLRTTTSPCDMDYEAGHWLMSDNCVALMPLR